MRKSLNPGRVAVAHSWQTPDRSDGETRSRSPGQNRIHFQSDGDRHQLCWSSDLATRNSPPATDCDVPRAQESRTSVAPTANSLRSLPQRACGGSSDANAVPRWRDRAVPCSRDREKVSAYVSGTKCPFWFSTIGRVGSFLSLI